jgi:hypothetical protein
MSIFTLAVFALAGSCLLFAKQRGWGLTLLLISFMVLLWRLG